MGKTTVESVGWFISRASDFSRWGGDFNSLRTWFSYIPATLFINQNNYD